MAYEGPAHIPEVPERSSRAYDCSWNGSLRVHRRTVQGEGAVLHGQTGVRSLSVEAELIRGVRPQEGGRRVGLDAGAAKGTLPRMMVSTTAGTDRAGRTGKPVSQAQLGWPKSPSSCRILHTCHQSWRRWPGGSEAPSLASTSEPGHEGQEDALHVRTDDAPVQRWTQEDTARVCAGASSGWQVHGARNVCLLDRGSWPQLRPPSIATRGFKKSPFSDTTDPLCP